MDSFACGSGVMKKTNSYLEHLHGIKVLTHETVGNILKIQGKYMVSQDFPVMEHYFLKNVQDKSAT